MMKCGLMRNMIFKRNLKEVKCSICGEIACSLSGDGYIIGDVVCLNCIPEDELKKQDEDGETLVKL